MLVFDSSGEAAKLLTDLHASTQTEDQVKSRLLLDIVIRKSSTVFQLLSGEDQALLVWRNPFLVLNLGLNIVDGIRGFDLERDGLASHCQGCQYQLMTAEVAVRPAGAGSLRVLTKICILALVYEVVMRTTPGMAVTLALGRRAAKNFVFL